MSSPVTIARPNATVRDGATVSQPTERTADESGPTFRNPPASRHAPEGDELAHPFDRGRSALVFIEFQNEWLDETAPLNRRIEDRRQFDDAVKNATTILAAARQEGLAIVHAGLSLVNDPTYLVFGGGVGKAGLRGAIPRTGGWRDPQRTAFRAPFVPEVGEFVVAGRSGASVLANSNLDAYLRNNRIDRLFLLGFVLHVCVESTLRHAHDLGYDVTVIGDAAPAFTAEQRDHVLTHVLPHFGTHCTTGQFLQHVGHT